MENKNADRRKFLSSCGKFVAFASVGSLLTSNANAGLRFEMDASTEGQCITCKFWGGIRKISEDGKMVEAQSLGWCNNPESKNYHKTTTPETGPMKAWRKWDALS